MSDEAEARVADWIRLAVTRRELRDADIERMQEYDRGHLTDDEDSRLCRKIVEREKEIAKAR